MTGFITFAQAPGTDCPKCGRFQQQESRSLCRHCTNPSGKDTTANDFLHDGLAQLAKQTEGSHGRWWRGCMTDEGRALLEANEARDTN